MIGLGLTPLANAIRQAGRMLKRRWIRRNSETAHADFEKIEIKGDFKISAKAVIYTPPVGETSILATSLHYAGRIAFGIDSDLKLYFWFGRNPQILKTSFEVPLKKINEVVVRRTGSDLYLENKTTGESEVFENCDLGWLDVDRIYKYINLPSFDGYIFDLHATDESGIRIDMPLDRYAGNSDLIPNYAKPLGPAISHDLKPGQYYSSISTGIYYSAGALSTDWVEVEPSTTYLIEPVGGKSNRYYYQYRNGSETKNGVGISGGLPDGGALLITAADAERVRFYFAKDGGEVGIASDISIRKATGWGQYINPLESDWGAGPFEKMPNGNWIGQNIAPDFKELSNWVRAGVAIMASENSIRVDNATDNGSRRAEISIPNAITGAKYDVEIGVRPLTETEPSFGLWYGWEIQRTPMNNSGVYEFNGLVTEATPLIRIYPGALGSYELYKLIAKEVLESE